MAPSGKRIKARRSTRKPRRRIQYKKQKKLSSKNEEPTSTTTSVDLAATNSTSVIPNSKTSKGKATFPTCNFHGCRRSQTPENDSVSVETNNGGACSESTGDEVIISGGCSTPKAHRFRIPEILTCPPAPKKSRVLSNCSIRRRRRPIAFFAPPDVELFFLFSLGHVPAA